MNTFFKYLAIYCLVGTVLGDGPVAPVGLPSAINPYYAGRNPVGPAYSQYYNPASVTAPILTYSNTQGIDGSYSYSFTTGDGKQAQENGFLKDAYIDKAGQPQGTQVKEGSYAYTSPEGIPIQVNYVADENGFRPAGVHIPSGGKGIVPSPLFNGLNGAYDPRLNLNNPYSNYRNKFGQFNPLAPFDNRNRLGQFGQFGQFNPLASIDNRNRFGQFGQFNPSAPVDPRYPYDPRYAYDTRYNVNNPFTAPAALAKDKKA